MVHGKNNVIIYLNKLVVAFENPVNDIKNLVGVLNQFGGCT
jgi:hypothetical protein